MPATYTSMLSVQVLDFEDNRLLIQHDRLICDSCSSGQRFACGFLQLTPHDANLAVRLILPPVGCIEDLHLQVSAPCRAHDTKKVGPFLTLLFTLSYCIMVYTKSVRCKPAPGGSISPLLELLHRVALCHTAPSVGSVSL